MSETALSRDQQSMITASDRDQPRSAARLSATLYKRFGEAQPAGAEN
jgi:hypothetical protein